MSSRINNINLYIKSVIFLCIFFLGLSATVDSFGQKINTDSIQKARKEFAEASRIARQKSVDSAREVRLRYADSLKSARKKVTDSLATIRKYKESKKYKDSLSRARAAKIDSARIVRAQFFDSVKAVRQQAIDSMNLARKRNTDSIRSIQKARADSLASIRNYRESKRYKDSVAFVRQSKLDSTRAARKAENEILVAERKRVLDSAASVRQAFNDSLKAERTKVADSIKLVRKARADSLTKMKENREKLTKSREKLSLEKKELAFQLKIKKKREVFSNEKMLKKKWSVPRKIIQNTYTRYNYYFNADRKMDEALDNMQRMRKENYDSLLALFPFDPDRDSTALAPDMDSIIQKASVGIQIHDPRTKWADDLYLLLGQAYYYKGNYDQATTAFKYIISLNQQRKAKELKEMAAKKKKSVKKDYSIVEPDEDKFLDFLKHESANNEAILWLARTFTESHKEKDAESILDLISTDKNMPEELHGRLALERAYLNISQGRSDLATGQLSVVAAEKSLPEWLRLRASYLNGQLLYNQGKYNEAATQFQEAIDLHPKIEMDFYARRNLAYSLMEQGGNQETATASLRHMLNDGKYLPYHEQVYYVLGRLSANSGDYKDAVTYLKKSVEGAKTTRRQKAISFASLGNVYYQQKDYPGAKNSYDSSAFYAKAAPGDSIVAMAARRAGLLDKITIPVRTIREQDSLLALALLSEGEQKAVIQKYLRYLEQKQTDSIERAANAADALAAGNTAPEGPPTDWYFANPMLVQQGLADFKRKWGTRPNSDNWRRVKTANVQTGMVKTTEKDEVVEHTGLPTEASLLAAIPSTVEKQQGALVKIRKAYIDLANGYVGDLKDYPSGLHTLDTMEHRFGAHEYKAEATYLRYRIAMEQNRLSDAQSLSTQLSTEFKNTKWGQKVAPAGESEVLYASNVPVSSFYDETYSYMMQRDYPTVLKRVREGQRQYKDPVYTDRFTIMEAIALAGAGDYGRSDTLLTEFLSTHPKDSLKDWAEKVIEYVKKNKPAEVVKPVITDSMAKAATVTKSGSQSQVQSPNDVAGKENKTAPVIPAVYTYRPKDPHMVLFYFNKMESKTLGVKAGMNDFNNFNYASQKLSVNLTMLQPTLGLISVKNFQNANQARIYLNAVRSSPQLLKEYKQGEYQLLMITEENYRKLEADKSMEPYLQFYQMNYK